MTPVLLLTTAFVGTLSIVAAADSQLVVQSESLLNFAGCSVNQTKQIYTAWNEAMEIAREAYRWIDSGSGYAKRDFIGGDDYVDDDAWNRVRGLVYYATTYGVAGKHSPFPTWEVNITCSDWMNRCNGGKQAYVTNPESRDGTPGIYMDTITFCPQSAFLTPGSKIESCPVRRDKMEKNRDHDLIDYQCWGWVVLHELFHLNSLSYRVKTYGIDGHVSDLWVEYYEAGDDSKRRRKVPAYSPFYVKILANYRGSNIAGRITTQNADNLAQFCLSLWVEYTGYSKLYPANPRVDEVGIGWGYTRFSSFDPDGTLILNTTAINARLPYTITSYPFSDVICDDLGNPDNCLVLSSTISVDKVSVNIPISFRGTPGFGNFSDAPSVNLSSYFPRNDTADSIPGSLPTPLGLDPSFFCYAGLGQNILYQPFVSQAFAQDSIAKMCGEIAGLALDPINNPSISVPFAPDPNTDALLWIQASWQVGDPACNGTSRTPSSDECHAELGHILNDCDTGSIESIDKKYGGTHLNNCIDWEIWINATIPASKAMSCVFDPEENICSCSDGVLSPFLVSVDPVGGCTMLYG